MPQQDKELIRQAEEARDAAARERAQVEGKLGEKERELRDTRRELRAAWKEEDRARRALRRVDGTRSFGFKLLAVFLGFILLFPIGYATFASYEGDTLTKTVSFESVKPAKNCPGAYEASYTHWGFDGNGFPKRQTRTLFVNDTILTERIRAAILRESPLNVTERYHGRTTLLGAFTQNDCAQWYVVKVSVPSKQGA